MKVQLPRIDSFNELKSLGHDDIIEIVNLLGHSDCHETSVALSMVTLLPITVLRDNEGVPIHSALMISDELLFDAYGFCSLEMVKQRYAHLLPVEEIMVDKGLDYLQVYHQACQEHVSESLKGIKVIMDYLGVTFPFIKETAQRLKGE